VVFVFDDRVLFLMEGWITIHRKIKEHWIWDDAVYLKAWLAILLTVNHEDNKVLIEGELIECKRGQSLLSLTGWSKCLGKKWTIQRVRTFFNLLKKDKMIEVEGLRKTTRVTICNYDTYQIKQQTNNKEITRRQQGDNNKQEGLTIIKNEKNIIPPPLELVIKYCKEKNSPIDPAYFHDWNTARGWKLKDGKLIVDWQATIRTWEQRQKKDVPQHEKQMLP
jgi:hypothetical protein